ncbi:MAG: DUF1295 domain-containing protein [Cyclobacteriaceae bacterium]
MDQFLIVFLQLVLLLFAYATGWYLLSLIKKRNDIADIAWGLGYCLVCGFLLLSQPTSNVLVLLYCLVFAWGIRLSVHIFIRNRGKNEDFRYLNWRKEWGRSFYWRSYLQVFLLQAGLLLLVVCPIVWAALNEPLEFSYFTMAGVLLWLIGFYFQSIGDYQLMVFLKNRTNSNQILNTGLWKYSRHPNYFGEILMWWGIYIIIIPLPYAVFFALSPLLITLLIAFVSGVPMLEKRYEGNSAYEAYKKNTPVLFPKFW